MATIYKRKNPGGLESWRVLIRRKGFPTFCLSFDSREEAEQWANEHEPRYLENPNQYFPYIMQLSLINNRKREFKRKI